MIQIRPRQRRCSPATVHEIRSLMVARISAVTASVVFLFAVSATAQDGTAYRTSLGTSLGSAADGSPRYREDSGWSSTNFSNPQWGVEYGSTLSPSPWSAVLQSDRTNATFATKANHLTLDLNGNTYSVRPYLSGSVVKGGQVTITDGLGTGAFLRVAHGTFDNNFGRYSSTVIGTGGAAGRLFVQDGLFKAHTAYVGGAASSPGFVTLDPQGRFTATNILYVGVAGTGSVQLDGAGSTLTAGRASIGDIGNNGSVVLNNASAHFHVTKFGGNTSGDLWIDNAVPAQFGQNVGLKVNAGQATIEGNLSLARNGASRYGAVEINGGTVSVAGSVQFGAGLTDTSGGKIILNGNDGRFEVSGPSAFAPNIQKQFYWNKGTLAFTGPSTTITETQLRAYTSEGAATYGGSRAAGSLATGQTLEAMGTLTLSTGTVGLEGGTIRAGNGLTLDSSLAGYGTIDAVVSGTGSIANTTSNSLSIGVLNGGNAIESAGDVFVGSRNSDAVYSGTSSGAGTFVKVGTGIQSVTGAVMNAGGVQVDSGTLGFNAATLDTSAITVSDGAKLGLTNGTQGTATSAAVGVFSTATSPASLQIAGSATRLAVANDLRNNGWIELTDGSLTVGGTLINDGMLVNNGVLDAVINGTGTVMGSGTFSGPVTIESGATLAPGNSPGTTHFSELSLGGGGIFEFEISDANGVAGTDWDLAVVSDALTVTATAANPYSIILKSLNSSFDVDTLSGFDPEDTYSWKFISAAIADPGAIDLAVFQIDESSFTTYNATGTGEFSVQAASDGLYLTFGAQPASVPEPGSLVLTSLLGLMCGGRLYLRRTRKPAM